MSDRKFVLNDGTDWFYFLGRTYSDVSYFADGEQMLVAQTEGWFIADHEAKVIESEKKAHQVRSGYKLVVDVPPSERFPAAFSVAEYDNLNDEDSDDYDPKVTALYEVEWEDVPAVRTLVEGEWFRLEGSPPPKDGHTWYANLPFELRHATEYRHLFPGHLDNFRRDLAERLNEIPGVTAYDQAEFSVYIQIQWDTPPLVLEKRGRDRKKKPYASRPVTHSVNLRPPRRIEGTDRATAAKEWDRLMADYMGQVQDAATTEACSACKGRGFRTRAKA